MTNETDGECKHSDLILDKKKKEKKNMIQHSKRINEEKNILKLKTRLSLILFFSPIDLNSVNTLFVIFTILSLPPQD